MKKIAVSAAVAAALTGSQAFAALGTGAAEGRFYVSGATAFSDTLLTLLTIDDAQNPCVVNANFELYLGTDTANSGLAQNTFAVTCDLRAGSTFANAVTANSGIAAGDTIEIHKADTGSGDGVRPFDTADSTPDGVVFFNNAQANNAAICNAANLTADDVSDFQTPLQAINAGASVLRCDGMTAGTTLNRTNGLSLGTSDVEPVLFGVTTVPAVNGPSLVWGVPVSIDLRDALQAFQFPASSVCHPSNGSYLAQAAHPNGDPMTELDGATAVTNRESEACQPSITRELMGDILTGRMFNWALVTNPNGDSLVSVASAAGLGPRAGDSTVYVCRRREGSGTEASYEAIFLRQRCEAGVVGMATPFNSVSAGGDPFDEVTCPGFQNDSDPDGDNVACGAPSGNLFSVGSRIFAGRGTGDVRECLTLHTQSDRTTTAGPNVNGDGTWAVGIFSTENRANDTNEGAVSVFGANYPNRRYRHIKVSGYIGSTYNAALGLYPYFSEVSLQTHASNQGPQSVALRNAARDGLAAAISQPNVLAQLNQQQPWGEGGSLAAMDIVGQIYESNLTVGLGDGSVDYPLNALEVSANPLIPRSKHLTGNVNNCQEPFHPGGFQSVAMPVTTNSNSRTDAQIP